MFTQFFGNYLLHKNIISQNQLMKALARVNSSKVRLGTLALSEGFMTATEIDEVLYRQTLEDKKFGEIAVDCGYLTDDQIKYLLDQQVSDFVLIGQLLVEDDCFTYEELERIIFDYKNENEIYDLELNVENSEKITELISKFFSMTDIPTNNITTMYLELLFNNLIRFIGEDFTPLIPMSVEEYPATYAVGQRIVGESEYFTFIDMDRDTAIHFASRYANEEFLDFNEYVMASIEDFINLHNGLFLVNASNTLGKKQELFPPEDVQGKIIKSSGACIVFPVVYPFGRINLIVNH